MRIPFGTIFGLLVVSGLSYALFFPTVGSQPSRKKAIAKSDVSQIAQAIQFYETEYGHLPTIKDGTVGQVLIAILTGSNATLNPRGIVFLEPRILKADKGGLSKDGDYLDPWGAPYQIALASGTNNFVVAGTNSTNVPKRFAVWSDPSKAKDTSFWFWRKQDQPATSMTSWE